MILFQTAEISTLQWKPKVDKGQYCTLKYNDCILY